METPLIGGFVEKQHEIKVRRGTAKRLKSLVSPSDCHKTAKIMTGEDAL
jgi:hypothetical protein